MASRPGGNGVPKSKRSLKCWAFLAVVLSTVSVFASIVLIPLLFHHIQRIQSSMQGRMETCKRNARNLHLDALKISAPLSQHSGGRTHRESIDDLLSSIAQNELPLTDIDPFDSNEKKLSPSTVGLRGPPRFVWRQQPRLTSLASDVGYGGGPTSGPWTVPKPPPFIPTPPNGQGLGCIQGPPGPPGPDGYPGSPGENGRDGIAGPPGRNAPINATAAPPPVFCQKCPPVVHGPSGIRGLKDSISQNPTFSVGIAGLQGDPGSPGVDGRPGRSGPGGSGGKPGPAGLPGIKGSTGVPGSVIANSLAGAPGPPGIQGQRGNPGRSGSDGRGVDGRPGPPGNRGELGSPGNPGPEGPPGQKGRQGPLGSCACPLTKYGPSRSKAKTA